MTTTTARPTPVVRELRAADAADIFELARAYDLDRFGRVETPLADVTPERPGSSERWYGVDVDGRLAIAGYVGWWQGGAAVEGDIIGPADVDGGAWHALLQRLRSDAAERYPDRPFHFSVDDAFTDWCARVEERGGHEVRRFYRMAVHLQDAPAEPPLTDGVTIRTIRDEESDLRRVFDVVDTSFRDHWGAEGNSDYDEFMSLARAEGRYDPSLWWIAEVGGEPAAVLIGRACEDGGHVSTLGTLREFRGRGLARALLLTAFAEFYRRGWMHVSLGVDATNPTGALRLYESVGMRPSVTWRCYELASMGPSPAGSSRSDSKNV